MNPPDSLDMIRNYYLELLFAKQKELDVLKEKVKLLNEFESEVSSLIKASEQSTNGLEAVK